MYQNLRPVLSLFFAVMLFGLCSQSLAHNDETIHYDHNPSYDEIPITPKTWAEVDLVYFTLIDGQRYRNTIMLLRPRLWLHAHHMDKNGRQVMLSIPEFGLVNIHTKVIAFKPTRIDTRGVNWATQRNSPIIGKFQRYVLGVRTYTFRDNHGHIDYIHATPNHPFYVQYEVIHDRTNIRYHPINHFIEISKITHNMVLTSKDGINITLMCNDNDIGYAYHLNKTDLNDNRIEKNHCGKPYRSGLVSAVYNLEIYRKHIYAAGEDSVLVHNNCPGLYRMNLQNLKEPTFSPKMDGQPDDVSQYTFTRYDQGSIPEEVINTLHSWAMPEEYKMRGFADKLEDYRVRLLQDINSSSYLFLYVVQRKDTILGAALFGKAPPLENDTSPYRVAYLISDPRNFFADTGRITGFGTRLEYEGFSQLKALFGNVCVRCSARTEPSARIHIGLGFSLVKSYP